MKDNYVIIADGLTKKFGTFTATDRISFRVKEGEIFGFLGANGAGKTTAMRMLCGLSRPTEGQATVAGFDVYRQAEEVKKCIGYMTGGVDPITRRQFWELIYRAADRGITVFVTTHYMDEAEYCDRVSIMVDGKIEALDTPENLKRSFNVSTMYDVFLALARKAKRSSD